MGKKLKTVNKVKMKWCGQEFSLVKSGGAHQMCVFTMKNTMKNNNKKHNEKKQYNEPLHTNHRSFPSCNVQ